MSNKVDIRITKKSFGLEIGQVKNIGRVVAVDMVNRGNAEFVNEEDEKEINERKAKNAKIANKVREINLKKSKAITKVDDERQEAEDKDAEKAKKAGQAMMLGKRVKALAPFAELVDIDSDAFKLSTDTTKEEFAVMKKLIDEAKTAQETDAVNAQKEADAKEDALEAPKKATPKKKGSKK